MGRFLSEDPVGLDGGIDFYSYVANNPVNRIDPSGKWVAWVHRHLTNTAAMNAGFSAADAAALAEAVVDADFLPGSQSTDFEWANLHATSGKKPNGMYQRCLEAYGDALGQLSHYIDVGNPAAIAAALHMIQDSYSPAHAGSRMGWRSAIWLAKVLGTYSVTLAMVRNGKRH